MPSNAINEGFELPDLPDDGAERTIVPPAPGVNVQANAAGAADAARKRIEDLAKLGFTDGDDEPLAEATE